MCPRIHGRPFGESGIAARATTVELQLQLLSAWCWCALLRWEVPSASVENNRSPGTVPLHSGRCDPLLPFGALLAPHTFILPSGRGVEELERRRRGTRRPSWQGIGTQGSTGADEHLHTRPSVVFGKCNRPSLSRGSPPTLDRQAVAKGAPSPASLSARSLATPPARVFAGPTPVRGSYPESPTRRRVAPQPNVPQRPLGLGLASYHQHHDDDEAPRGLARCTASAWAGKRSSAGEFGTLGKGNAVWGPVFSW